MEYHTMVRDTVACETVAANGEKIECWLQVAFDEVRNGSVEKGYAVFEYLYDTYPEFASTGCHVYAHRMGDITYYQMFVANGLTLDEMEFPQETTSCGYGFFHGFIEHYIQDQPEEAFVQQTCEYLRSRLSGTMRDIGTICYHASGHGYMQAQLETMPRSMEGKPLAIINDPLRRCEKMDIDEREKEDCREGVFNVLTEWMRLENVGLKQDLAQPLALCSKVALLWQEACYYELGQQVGQIIGTSPIKAASLAAGIPNKDQKSLTFGVMVAGIMQSQTALDQYEAVMRECAQIADEGFFSTCVTSVANGMMEHGSPGKEYEKVLDVCSAPELTSRDGTRICYDTLAKRLMRFYPHAESVTICRRYPSEYRNACFEAITSASPTT